MSFGPTGGTLISILISSQLADRFGRRYPICGGSIIIIIGSIIQSAAQNYAMFVASRFLVGFGLGIVSVSAPPLLSEVAYPSQRPKLVSFYLVTWPLGSLIAALITYGSFKMDNSWAWRLPSLLQCFFSAIQAVLSLFCPESPRWLIYQNRQKEAQDVLVKYHGEGDPNSELVLFEIAEITATLELEKIQNKSRWAEWIASPGMRHRLFLAAWIPAMLQWSGSTFPFPQREGIQLTSIRCTYILLSGHHSSLNRHHQPKNSAHHQRLSIGLELAQCLSRCTTRRSCWTQKALLDRLFFDASLLHHLDRMLCA